MSTQTIQSKCQRCQKPITLKCHDSYTGTFKPENLLHLVVCNECHDRHVRQRKLEDVIGDVCIAISRKPDAEELRALKSTLRKATRKYADVIAEVTGRETVLWDEAFPELLFDYPTRWPVILRKYRQDCSREHPTRA